MFALLLCMAFSLPGIEPALADQPPQGTPTQTGFGGGLKELARQATPSVALLQITNRGGRQIGNGTGFAVSEGILATNYHVIDEAFQVKAVFPGGREVRLGKVLAEDRDHDLALLELPAAIPPLPMFDSRLLERGEDVVVLGSPEGLSGTLSTGIVSAIRPKGLDDGIQGPLVQITAPISPGSSGSPVMNLRGEVLGVAVAVHRTGQNLNFAVPSERLRQLLDQVSESARPVREIGGEQALTERRLLIGRNLVISLLVFGVLAYFLRRI